MAERPSWVPELHEVDGPVYAAIVELLSRDIAAGVLAPGDRLPTHRELAGTLATSVGTITRAYTEAERRGLIHSRVGRGTFVRDLRDRESYSPVPDRGRIDLGPMAVPAVPGDLGHSALAAALQRLGGRADLVALSGYQPHGGTAAQKRAGVRWLAASGAPAEEAEIVVSAGIQHGISVLLGLFARSAGVLVEELGYAGVLEAAQQVGVPIHPVAMDAHGMIPDALDEAARVSGAKVVCVTPTAHNPTSTTMPRARREELIAVCRARDIVVVENGAMNPLVGDAPPTLAALAPERTHYLGSLSKATVPALRVGYIRSPSQLTAAVERGVGATLWSASPLLAEIATQWVNDGTAEAIRDSRRAEAVARQRIAAAALAGHRFSAHPESYFLWLELPESRSALGLVEAAAARDVLVGPAHVFAARPGAAPNAIRISVSAPATRSDLERGLAAIAELLSGPAHRLY